VCPFSTSTKFWQNYSRKTCPILGAKLVVNRPGHFIVDQCSISDFFEGLKPKGDKRSKIKRKERERKREGKEARKKWERICPPPKKNEEKRNVFVAKFSGIWQHSTQ